MYASHVDTLIYSYYNLILSDHYERKLQATEFDQSIIAYRKLGKSNIDFAYSVFQEIQSYGECDVLAFDVSDFFPGLNHQILKSSWEHVMDFEGGDNKVFMKKLLLKHTDEVDKLLTDDQREKFRGNFISYAK